MKKTCWGRDLSSSTMVGMNQSHGKILFHRHQSVNQRPQQNNLKFQRIKSQYLATWKTSQVLPFLPTKTFHGNFPKVFNELHKNLSMSQKDYEGKNCWMSHTLSSVPSRLLSLCYNATMNQKEENLFCNC